jgi:hypothetical protein
MSMPSLPTGCGKEDQTIAGQDDLAEKRIAS